MAHQSLGLFVQIVIEMLLKVRRHMGRGSGIHSYLLECIFIILYKWYDYWNNIQLNGIFLDVVFPDLI